MVSLLSRVDASALPTFGSTTKVPNMSKLILRRRDKSRSGHANQDSMNGFPRNLRELALNLGMRTLYKPDALP